MLPHPGVPARDGILPREAMPLPSCRKARRNHAWLPSHGHQNPGRSKRGTTFSVGAGPSDVESIFTPVADQHGSRSGAAYLLLEP